MLKYRLKGLNKPSDVVLRELILDTAYNTLELPYMCVKVAQNSLLLSEAGLCNLYLIYDGVRGKELLSMAHSISYEDLYRDPREIKLSHIVWDTRRGVLGHVARTGEAIMLKRMFMVCASSDFNLQLPL